MNGTQEKMMSVDVQNVNHIIGIEKKCCICKQTKNRENDFSNAKKSKDGKRSQCITCERKYGKEYIEKNKEYFKNYNIEYRKTNRDKLKKFKQNRNNTLMEWINLNGYNKCSVCGYDKYFGAIDFHHVNPSEKEMAICNFLFCKITEKRLSEIKKTIPLCKNCHAEEHHKLREKCLNKKP